MGVTIKDRILLLSTCSTDSTNGRDILFARITDKTYPDTFMNEKNGTTNELVTVDQQPSLWDKLPGWFGFVLPIAILAALVMAVLLWKKKQTKKE